MDLESAQNNALTKLPLLKQEDGNSFEPVARTTTNADGTSTSTIPGVVSAEEKIQKKNDLKARSILMMTLPSEHLLTFNQYKDAKTLFEAIEARFGGNEATKKTQKTLLKQISLPSEWSMHVVVWRNKPDLGSISFDDLYNNFKIVEQEVKRSVISSSNSSSQNVAFVSTPSSTNDVNTSNVHVSTASSSLSTASSTDNTARLSDATIYAFLANQPNGSQVVHEDLEQIHEDDLEEMDLKWQLALLSMKARKFSSEFLESTDPDRYRTETDNASSITYNASTTDNTARLNNVTIYAFLANQPNGSQVVHEDLEQIYEDDLEEIDLKWQLALLSMKARKFYQRTGKKIIINGSDIVESSSKAMLAIDGVGFDWIFMTEEKTPTNFALMAFSDSELNKTEFDLANYKRGLASVEEQLVFYKKNKGMLCDQIVVLKRDASFNESEINALKIQIERLKKEKESNQIKIDNFENASKCLDKLIGCQISYNNRKCVGYNAVPPPPPGLFAPPTIDLSNSGLEEFKQPAFEEYGVKVNKSVSENSYNEIKKTYDAPIIEDWIFDCDEDETLEKVLESANVQKPKQADQLRKISQNPRNNSTNWNTPMSKKLGLGFQFAPKACFVCGIFNHLIKDCDFHDNKMVQIPVLNNVKKGTGQREVRPVWNNAMRTNHQNFSNSRRNFAPTAVLTKSDLVPISTARQNSSRTAATISAARPIKTAAPKPFVNVAKTRSNAFQKLHSPTRRPFYQQTALKNRNLNNKVNTVKANSINTAKGKRVTSAVGEQGIDSFKSKA
ncbi:hypothetical protein Tco_0766642 [Tanacetum coccineum]